MSMKQRSLKLRLENMKRIEPLTDNQKKVFEAYKNDYHIVLAGSAGTGKTFVAMNLALEDVLDKNTPYDKLIVLRSIVPTRDIGFLPGDEEEKKLVYELPYKGICHDIFGMPDAWEKLKASGEAEFMTTSFIRGITIDNAIIIVDEMQNLNYHELCSIMTRIGQNTRIIFCGDYYQSDFHKKQEQDGILKFLRIMEIMSRCTIVEFTWEDIVRSDIVREFIMSKEMLERS